jgi:alpha-galactosidase
MEGKSLYPQFEETIRKSEIQIEGEGAIVLKFYKIYGLLPGPADRHIAEFFPKLFLTEKAMEKYGILKFPEDTIYDYKGRKPFEELLLGVASGSKSVAELLGVKGMEEEGIGVVRLMESLTLDKPMLYPGINVVNKNCIGNLPSWSVVEVPTYVDSTGIHPVQVGDLPNAVAGFTTQRILQYETTIDAALTRDKNLALQALLLDGYVDGIETAEKLLNDMLQAEKDWLPEY